MMAWYKVGVPLDSILQMASQTTFKQISKNLSVSSVGGQARGRAGRAVAAGRGRLEAKRTLKGQARWFVW
jgi:hypothetical protein